MGWQLFATQTEPVGQSRRAPQLLLESAPASGFAPDGTQTRAMQARPSPQSFAFVQDSPALPRFGSL
jgi:hypothetical protein